MKFKLGQQVGFSERAIREANKNEWHKEAVNLVLNIRRTTIIGIDDDGYDGYGYDVSYKVENSEFQWYEYELQELNYLPEELFTL